MVYTLTFPSTLTEEEQQLKQMFDVLRKVKKIAQQSKQSKQDFESGKSSQKRGLDDAEILKAENQTHEVKRLVKAGTMTINKHEEKQTFKRSKQLDRKLKDGEIVGTTKFQPFSSSMYNDYNEGPSSSSRPKFPHLYDSFVETGENSSEKESFYESNRKGTTIYVRGYDLMEKPLKASFGDFGKVVRVHVEDRQRSAFVEFATHEEADRAIKEMNGNMVNGITLRVTMARRQNYTPKTFNYFDSRSGASVSRGWSDLAANRSEKSSNNREGNDRDIVSYEDAADV